MNPPYLINADQDRFLRSVLTSEHWLEFQRLGVAREGPPFVRRSHIPPRPPMQPQRLGTYYCCVNAVGTGKQICADCAARDLRLASA